MVTNANGMATSMNAITTTTCQDVAVGETKSQIGSISLYPNPSKDMATLTFNTQNATTLNVNVYDITGKLVLSPAQNQNLSQGDHKFSIDTEKLYNGIYFVTLSTPQGKETVKLVVNK
jgi:hypothetical protein